MAKRIDGGGFVVLPGTDIAGPVHEGSPCIVCHKPVAPGEGAQAMPPLPAMHSKCLAVAVGKLDGARKR